eukprot:CAMPEP_0180705884 /NCGR_PEP_ID=MMETSP1038_2-20121128/7907_1 /TAXON_ID=632150 /ORGANISM="Azadinium spinosum, Strain 3D9" /LENGTH=139 /DNA_ID=CAMNT_0022737773 /DNA_START=186 /DNA_END=602 /DNA_ORIENTATION=+
MVLEGRVIRQLLRPPKQLLRPSWHTEAGLQTTFQDTDGLGDADRHPSQSPTAHGAKGHLECTLGHVHLQTLVTTRRLDRARGCRGDEAPRDLRLHLFDRQGRLYDRSGIHLQERGLAEPTCYEGVRVLRPLPKQELEER